MTNEEAIEILDNDIEVCTIQQKQACDMAKKALEQQPCKDCISREDILNAIETWDKFGFNAEQKLIRWQDHYVPYVHLDDVRNAIANMPSVTPKASEQTDTLDKIITQIEQVRDKDKLCEYPYNRCINIIKEEIKNENNSNG